MNIQFNDQPLKLPTNWMTISDLIQWKGINPQGTAVALNDKLVTRNQWTVKRLSEGDRITIISAAFGG